MKRSISLLALLVIISLTISPVYAVRYGVFTHTSMGDIPGSALKKEPISIAAFYLFDKNQYNIFHIPDAQLLTELSINSLPVTELNLIYLIPMANIGPRRYNWMLGSTIVAGSSTYVHGLIPAGGSVLDPIPYQDSQNLSLLHLIANSASSLENISLGLLAGVQYQEELSYGFYLDARATMYSNLRYKNESWPIRLSAALTYYFDKNNPEDSTTKLTFVDIDSVLSKYKTIAKLDVNEDRTERIKEISDVTKGLALKLPKFVQRGKAFNAFKEFGEGAENIESVSCKIDLISNKLYKFKRLDDKRWATRILVPATYDLPQINITLYVKRKDGRGFEEYITTLVE